jgi:hypothetical protein
VRRSIANVPDADHQGEKRGRPTESTANQERANPLHSGAPVTLEQQYAQHQHRPG